LHLWLAAPTGSQLPFSFTNRLTVSSNHRKREMRFELGA